MNGGTATGVNKVCAESESSVQLGKPSTAPNPVCRQRKNQCSQNRGHRSACEQPPPVRARAPRNQRCERHRQELEDESELGSSWRGIQTLHEERPGSEPVPGLANRMKDVARST